MLLIHREYQLPGHGKILAHFRLLCKFIELWTVEGQAKIHAPLENEKKENKFLPVKRGQDSSTKAKKKFHYYIAL